MTTNTDPLPCGFKFSPGVRCLAIAGHVIHRGRWAGSEPNHDYEPFDRRKAERRAARYGDSTATQHRSDTLGPCLACEQRDAARPSPDKMDALTAAAAFMLELVDYYYGTDQAFAAPEEAQFRHFRAVIEEATPTLAKQPDQLRDALRTVRDVDEWSRQNGDPLFKDETVATLDAALHVTDTLEDTRTPDPRQTFIDAERALDRLVPLLPSTARVHADYNLIRAALAARPSPDTKADFGDE